MSKARNNRKTATLSKTGSIRHKSNGSSANDTKPLMASKGKEEIKEVLLGTDPTRDYQSSRFSYYGELFVQQIPQWRLWTGRMMISSDPIIQFMLNVRSAALAPAQIKVKAKNPRIKKWVEDQWNFIWNHHFTKLIEAKRWGFNPLQVQWKLEKDGLIHIKGLKDFAPEDCRALVVRNRLVGHRVQGHRMYFPQALWIKFNAQHGSPYGTGCLRRAYPAWYEKWMDHGAKRLLQLRMIKDSYIGDIFWYPPNMLIEIPDGNGGSVKLSYRDLMRELGENRLSGGALTMPMIYDNNGKELTKYTPPQDVGYGSQIFDWNDKCDEGILWGGDIPIEVVKAQETGSGYSGRSIPFITFLSTCTTELKDIVECVNEQVLRPGAWLNFGGEPEYEIEVVSLVESFSDDTQGSPMGGGAVGGQPSTQVQQAQQQELPPDSSGKGVQYSEEEREAQFAEKKLQHLEGIYHHDRANHDPEALHDFKSLVAHHGGKISPVSHSSDKHLFKVPNRPGILHDFGHTASDNGHTEGHHFTYKHENEDEHEEHKHGSHEKMLQSHGYSPHKEYYHINTHTHPHLHNSHHEGWLAHKPTIHPERGSSRTVWSHHHGHQITIFDKSNGQPDKHMFRSNVRGGKYGHVDGNKSGDLRKLLKKLHPEGPGSQHSEDSIPGGKGDKANSNDFDKESIAMGMKVEMEHTSDPKVALEIALDHLTEDKEYYTKLKKAGLADELESQHSDGGIPSNGVNFQFAEFTKLDSGLVIHHNPTQDKVHGLLARHGELRGYVEPSGKHHVWDAHQALHEDVIKHVGANDTYDKAHKEKRLTGLGPDGAAVKVRSGQGASVDTKGNNKDVETHFNRVNKQRTTQHNEVQFAEGQKHVEGIYHADQVHDPEQHKDFHRLVRAHGGKVFTHKHSGKHVFTLPADHHKIRDFHAAAEDNGHSPHHHQMEWEHEVPHEHVGLHHELIKHGYKINEHNQTEGNTDYSGRKEDGKHDGNEVRVHHKEGGWTHYHDVRGAQATSHKTRKNSNHQKTLKNHLASEHGGFKELHESQHEEAIQFTESETIVKLRQLVTRGLVAKAKLAQERLEALGQAALDLPTLAGLVEREIKALAPLLTPAIASLGLYTKAKGLIEVEDSLPKHVIPTGRPLQAPATAPEIKSVLGGEVDLPALDSVLERLERSPIARGSNYLETAKRVRERAFAITTELTDKAVLDVKDLLSTAIKEGQTKEDFIEAVVTKLGSDRLSEPHLENILRTNQASLYSDARMEALGHDLVADAFPYCGISATHDARTRPHHAELERLGLDGTNIYRSIDPTFKKFRAPWDYQCRCSWYPVSVEQAARKGVQEAKDWWEKAQAMAKEKGGSPYQYLVIVKPSNPQFVTPPPFNPTPGFIRDQS